MTHSFKPVSLNSSPIVGGTHFEEPKFTVGFRTAQDTLPVAAVQQDPILPRALGGPTTADALRSWLLAPLQKAGARVFLSGTSACLPLPGVRNAPLTPSVAAPTSVAMAPFAAAVGAIAALDERGGSAACVHGARLLRRLDAVPTTSAGATMMTAIFHGAQGCQPVSMLNTVPHNSGGVPLAVDLEDESLAGAYAFLEKGYRHLQARTCEPPPEFDPEGSTGNAVEAIAHALNSLTGTKVRTLSWNRDHADMTEAQVVRQKRVLRALLNKPEQAVVLVLAPAEAQASALGSQSATDLKTSAPGLELTAEGSAQAVLTGTPLVLVRLEGADKVLVLDPMRLAPSDWYATPTLQELAEVLPEPPKTWLTRWLRGPSTVTPPAYRSRAAEFLANHPADACFTVSLDQLAQLSHTLVTCFSADRTAAVDEAHLNAMLTLAKTPDFAPQLAVRELVDGCHWEPSADNCFDLKHGENTWDRVRRHPQSGQFIRVRAGHEVGAPFAAMEFIKAAVKAVLPADTQAAQ